MGALVGTAVALGLYGAYSVGMPAVQGLLANVSSSAEAREEQQTKFTDADRVARQVEIAARAREIIERMRREGE